MPEYYFETDRRMFMWQREKFTVIADNPEEAISKAKDLAEEMDYDQDKGYIDTETMFETATEMSLQDNGDYSTIELRDDQGNVIWQNGTPNS